LEAVELGSSVMIYDRGGHMCLFRFRVVWRTGGPYGPINQVLSDRHLKNAK
jgi:hypothetical protein